MKILMLGIAVLASLSMSDDKTPAKPILEIHFVGAYQDDTIGLILNNNLVMGNRILSSESSDFADHVVYVSATEKNYYIMYQGDTTKAKIRGDKLADLNFQLNSHDKIMKDNIFMVDPNKGKYILISKKAQNKLGMEQSKVEPK